MKRISLSNQARSLWAKSDSRSNKPDYEKGQEWLPLFVHMSDSGKVAEFLWREWLPESTKQIVARPLGGDEGLAKRTVVFLVTLHDLGKATPIFQVTPCDFGVDADERSLAYKPRGAGLPFGTMYSPDRLPKHPVAGQALLKQFLEQNHEWEYADSFASIIGCHHGKPSEKIQVRDALETHPKEMGLDPSFKGAWTSVHEELIHFAQELSGFNERDMQACASLALPAQTASVVTGIVIMCDWIASNECYFPLVPLRGGGESLAFVEKLDDRADRALLKLDIQPSWQGHVTSAQEIDDFYRSRFGFPESAEPYPVQKAALRIAGEAADLGMVIIEAPMGEGKTEAALAAAEVLASRAGCGGVCVALPTMATTDAMFGRVHSWLDRMLPEEGVDAGSIYLAHSKARLNEEYQGILRNSFDHASSEKMSDMNPDDDQVALEESVYVSGWMRGRKCGMLADFVVSTIDQVLMAGLAMKHLSLRHLALANKVVILDEVHACDAYMREYLKMALQWLGSWKTPVVLLSATLSEGIRNELLEAYMTGRKYSSWEVPKESSYGGWRSKKRHRGKDALANSSAEANVVQQLEPAPSAPDAYPLITYTEGMEVRYEAVAPSSRKSKVDLSLLDDGDESLVRLLEGLLSEGGVAGVVCDTVGRAQHVAELLRDRIPDAEVMLAHSRFIDVDRMQNEERLRKELGPRSAVAEGSRPQKAIFVGTQVLEQSLDIDFDVMVTDIAPVDLIMQRIGRLHRHSLGEGESQRPAKLRRARAYVRGIESWEWGVPDFDRGVATVYPKASLMEALAVLGLTEDGASTGVCLPEDIAAKVRLAYSDKVQSCIPGLWEENYEAACANRAGEVDRKIGRADVCRIPSVHDMCEGKRSLTGWYESQMDHRVSQPTGSIVERSDERGRRAVRDSQESIEVLLLEEAEGGMVKLLPWVGDESSGVPNGAELPTAEEPPENIARLASLCSVCLPFSLCKPSDIDALIDELEDACEDRVATWQDSCWLAGCLPLLLHRDGDGRYVGEARGRMLSYTREEGLKVEREDQVEK